MYVSVRLFVGDTWKLGLQAPSGGPINSQMKCVFRVNVRNTVMPHCVSFTLISNKSSDMPPPRPDWPLGWPQTAI